MKIVYTTGVFDLLHIGHLKVLEAAANLGDILVVGVTSDEFTRRIKPRQPIIPYEQRAALIGGLRCVNFVEPTVSHLDFRPMRKHHVGIRALAPDWGHHPEQREAGKRMLKMGIKLVTLPRTPNISTSIIIERIRDEEGCCDRGRRLEGRWIPRTPS